MIGLGSNRLSVCRRGGMSVTQAGKGGMEWLGVRGPSWATPYSAQATAALKAQFPTQWPTIRDYGVSHPEIVDDVNAAPVAYFAPYVLISTTSGIDLEYVLDNAQTVNIAVFGGTSAAVSKMQITINGTLAYDKLQSQTAYGGTNSGGVDVGCINTARMNASSDWWRVSSRGYVVYNGTCYTDWQQILHIERLNTRQEFDMIGLAS